MEQDPRLNGQEEYLQNALLYKIVFPDFWKKAYAEKNEFYQKILRYAENHVQSFPDTKQYLEGDQVQHFWHKHCEFCFEKALTDKSRTFYCTEDMNYWICEECFQDFRKIFHWQEKTAEEKSERNRNGKSF